MRAPIRTPDRWARIPPGEWYAFAPSLLLEGGTHGKGQASTPSTPFLASTSRVGTRVLCHRPDQEQIIEWRPIETGSALRPRAAADRATLTSQASCHKRRASLMAKATSDVDPQLRSATRRSAHTSRARTTPSSTGPGLEVRAPPFLRALT